MNNTEIAIIVKVIYSMILGGAIGWEREVFKKSAGFRTHMFISGAATLLVILSQTLVDGFGDSSGAAITADPTRVVEAIVVGVSFVGGGMIIQRKKKGVVKNLTTASSLLFTAAIGIAVSLDKMILSLILTVLTVLVNRGLYIIEVKFIKNKN